MGIGLETLGYTFNNKPLLIGGKALEYYGISMVKRSCLDRIALLFWYLVEWDEESFA